MKHRHACICLSLLVLMIADPSHAVLKPASPFCDSMVIQQQQPIPVWGWSEAGETVTVKFLGQEKSTQADEQGRWRLVLDAVEATPDQQPTTMVITSQSGSGESVELVIRDVLVGEVWVCSGQSNMNFPVMSCTNAEAEQAGANFPMIRMFTPAEGTAPLPMDRCGGIWTVCSPDNVGLYSGVGYFFARKVHQELGVPVGMIHSSVGGTAIIPWTPLEALKETKAAGDEARRYEKERDLYLSETNKYNGLIEEGKKRREKELAEYDARVFASDVGHTEGWATGSLGSGEWKSVDMPLPVRELGKFCGSAWCRNVVSIDREWLGKALSFNFGSIDEADEVYVNGVLIGETHDNSLWQTPRHYSIPATLVTNTELTIVVRVMNQVGAMGIGGSPGDFSLQVTEAPGAKLPLTTGWTYALGSPLNFSDRPVIGGAEVPGIGIHPSTLYNAMIAPVVGYAAKGSLWYQGEADSGRWVEYTELLPAMIQAWRKAWGQPSFHFLIVQLANYAGPQVDAIELNSCADIRDVQRKVLSTTPETGMAVSLDTGDGDGHPRNKQDVGLRLALWALAKIYGRTDIVASGPLYRSLSIESNRAIVTLDYVGGGLTVKGPSLVSFAIAGSNKVFYAAQAEIQGDTVTVWSDKVPEPQAVRYAWGMNPACTLYNKAGLPASSFRSDDWSNVTCGK